MKISIHDNWIYAHEVDHDERMIILHTVYPHCDPHEFTDVIFEDVLVHYFETEHMTTRLSYPSNVLDGIDEADANCLVRFYVDEISKQKNYGWPVSGWSSIEHLAQTLTSGGHRGFHIQSTVGLGGFVFARRMILKSRSSRWSIRTERVNGTDRD